MSSIEARIAELGLALPTPPPAAGAYVPAVRSGALLFLAGTLPVREGRVVSLGKVGSLERVERVVMVNGFVNGVDGFSDSPKVLNGASEFLLHVFGEAGRHARAAVSVNGLPLGASVEVQLTLQVRD
ncbi:MAG: RidA family protein [Opitutales bacterium]